MNEPAIVTEPAGAPAGGQAEQRIAVATQWQLMWWRFRKHRLAVGGTLVPGIAGGSGFGVHRKLLAK